MLLLLHEVAALGSDFSRSKPPTVRYVILLYTLLSGVAILMISNVFVAIEFCNRFDVLL